MKLVLLLASLSMLVAGCPRDGEPPVPAPMPAWWDGGFAPTGDAGPPATCDAVCARWGPPSKGGLGCTEGRDPERCLAVCRNVASNGGLVQWDLDCRARVTDCGQIDRCEQGMSSAADAGKVGGGPWRPSPASGDATMPRPPTDAGAASGGSQARADAGPAPPPPSCETACATTVRLGCAPAKTPRGATCAEVCENVRKNGAGFTWDVACRTRASSCAALEACR